MKRDSLKMLLIHGIAAICEICFILILLFGKEESKWQVGAMSLNIGMAGIGLIGVWKLIDSKSQ